MNTKPAALDAETQRKKAELLHVGTTGVVGADVGVFRKPYFVDMDYEVVSRLGC